ncbi:expressed unknown protein [Ectocarpus siliculosus]|uniref:Uncharacterized protein n=1 Tax=Ectocarpus siliculosus TaxID=2880 RepID=D7FH94_ECTSI|nr:expressed unknown protein [Ectocarpus siliculosus]|eukprot:CBJ28465.1 expressed unknown protein [Ectocarpus siliculosus]
MGVRQRNSPPSPPLVSALPPKRPRTPGDDPGHGKRPRNGCGDRNGRGGGGGAPQ